jgi:acetyl-CoA synthetase
LTGETRTLDEVASKRRLADAGVPIPRGIEVAAHDVGRAALEIGFPVVLKAIDPGLLHKSDAGAVAVGLRDVKEVARALERMNSALAAPPRAYLVEAMVEGALAEVIVGVKYDASFGHALVMGSGGVLVELVGDTVTLLLPTSREAIAEALGRLRIDRLLRGFRGRPAGDRAGLVEAIVRIGAFAMKERERLLEVDVNPLLVLAEGQGVVAVDALITLADAG